MPLQTIRLNPGVNVEATRTQNAASITASQLIRFKPAGEMVLVEKMGGWQKFYPASVGSPVRSLRAWSDISTVSHLAIAAETSLNILTNGAMQKITPLVTTDNVAVDFSTTSGSNQVIIVDAGVVTSTLDSIVITTPISVGGLVLQGAYPVALTLSGVSYQINAASNATSTVSHGGAVPIFATTNGSAAIKVNIVNHGQTIGTNFSVPTPTTVGGLTVSGSYIVQTVIDADHFTINASNAATSTDTESMNGGNAQIVYYITTAPSGPAAGYGIGTYGPGGYGIGIPPVASPGSTLTTSNWSLDNWGEILLACPTGGAIFQWSPDGGYTAASKIVTAPIASGGIFISNPSQILIAWGASIGGVRDPLLVSWSDSGNYGLWSATALTQAGSYRIPNGSKIMGGLQGPQFGFIWTDVDVWSMTYIQPPFVFGFNKLADECGLIGQHAACATNSTVYWMGNNQFFQYAGQGVQPIVCSVWDVVFQDLDQSNLNKITAASNNGFGEVMWYYPSISGGTGEVDSYVKFNFILNCWDYGKLDRTAWIDQSVAGQPIGASSLGFIYQHEVANEADGVAMGEFFETGYAQIAEGEELMFVDWMIPDFKYGKYTGPKTASLNITLKYTDYPDKPERSKGPYQVNSANNYRNPRIRAREVRMRIEGAGLGGWWRMGGLRYRAAPDGKR